MKKVISFILTFALMLSMASCASAPVGVESTPTSMPEKDPATAGAAETSTVTEPATETLTEPPISGTLFLTVSAITFSVVGEAEDIYAGSVPREAVTWSVADESVATFRDGILTATGVGTTTAVAEFEDQRIACSVGCLAATEAELKTLSKEILHSPKRYPPTQSALPDTYFDDAAIIGDSISYVLFQIEAADDLMGSPLFLVRGGAGLQGIVNGFYPIIYRGEPTHPADALAASGVTKAFIMMAQNDLSYTPIDETMEYWKLLMDEITEKNPDVEIFIQSTLPECFDLPHTAEKNQIIYEHNRLLQEYAAGQGFHYLDIAKYIEDHCGNMAAVYSQDDGIHMVRQGCHIWVQVLKTYVEILQIQGQLP